MAPKNLRSTVNVAKDLTALTRDAFEVEIPVKLLAEMIRAGYGAVAPGDAMQGLGAALANAIIDDRATATPYKHAFDPVYSEIMEQARSEHILDNISSSEAHNYPRDTAQ